MTMDGKVCGSPAYMSPEQCKGADVDLRSDIYSLGVVFSEVLTGQRPFAADDLMALMLMHVNKEAPSIGAMSPEQVFPPGLSNVISKALQKNKEDRHQSTKEFWREIEKVCIGRKSKKSQEEQEPEPEEEWKVFTDLNLNTPPPPTKERSSIQQQQEWSGPQALTPEEEALDRLDPNWRENLQKKKKEKKKSLAINLNHLKVVVYLLVLVVSVTFLNQHYANWNNARIAKQLYSKGNYEGCVQILEDMEKSSSLSKDLRNNLDDSYLKLAKQSAKSRDYKKAISYLDKVKGEGSLKKEKDDLSKRYKRYTR